MGLRRQILALWLACGSSASASGSDLPIIELSARGIDADQLQSAIEMRIPELRLRSPGSETDTPLALEIDVGPAIEARRHCTIRLRDSSGHDYQREVDVPASDSAFHLARSVASLLLSIDFEADMGAAARDDESTQESDVDESAGEDIVPESDSQFDEDEGALDEAVQRPADDLRRAQRDQRRAERQLLRENRRRERARERARRTSIRQAITQRMWVSGLAGLRFTLGSDDYRGLAGSGGGVELGWLERSGATVAVDAGVVSRRRAAAALTRVRVALAAGYTWQRGDVQVAGSFAGFVEPWFVTVNGRDVGVESLEGSATPGPAIGLRGTAASYWVPRLQVHSRREIRLRLGIRASVAGSRVTGQSQPTSGIRGRASQRVLGRIGGPELGLELSLGILFGLRQSANPNPR